MLVVFRIGGYSGYLAQETKGRKDLIASSETINGSFQKFKAGISLLVNLQQVINGVANLRLRGKFNGKNLFRLWYCDFPKSQPTSHSLTTSLVHNNTVVPSFFFSSREDCTYFQNEVMRLLKDLGKSLARNHITNARLQLS